MTIYGKWNLILNPQTNEWFGPELEVASQNIDMIMVWSIGSPEDGGTIVGKFSNLPENLSNWGFVELSRQDVVNLIQDTFTYRPSNPDDGSSEYTIEMALSNLD
jgi:hypothetical protein